MLSSWTIVCCILTLLASLVFFCLAGILISFTGKGRPAILPHLFFSYLIKGLLFSVSLYAIWITRGKTILLLVPVLLLIAGFFEKLFVADSSERSLRLKHFIVFILSACLLYALYYAQALLTDGDLVKYAGGDTSFYARAAYNLQVNGIENAKIEYLYPGRFNPEPYHYYDLWFTAFISDITGINTHLVYVLIVYPFFSVLFVIGIWTFCAKYFRNPAYSVITIFACFFVGFNWFYPYFILKDAYVFDFTPSFLVKTCLTGCLIIYSMLALLKHDWTDLLVTVTVFAVGYVNLAPAFALSVLVMILIGVYQKQVTFKTIAGAVSLLLIQAAYFFYFYRSDNHGSLFGAEINWIYFKKSLVLFFEGFIQFFILFPFLILLLLQFPRPGNLLKVVVANKPVLFLILLPLAGIICWGLSWGLGPQSVQFFYNIFTPASAICISLILLKSINSKKLIFRFIGVIAVVLLIVKNHEFGFQIEKVEKKDMATLNGFMRKYDRGSFVNIKAPEEFRTFFDKSTTLAMPLLWIGYIDNAYQNYSLNTTLLEVDTTVPYHYFEKKALEESPFSFFASQEAIKGNKKDLQMEFIKSNSIKYMSVSPLAKLDKKYTSLLQDSIQLSNGWRVFKLIY